MSCYMHDELHAWDHMAQRERHAQSLDARPRKIRRDREQDARPSFTMASPHGDGD